MRFRVRHFGNRWWLIEYRKSGFFSMWRPLRDPFILSDLASRGLWDRNAYTMMKSFESAVEFAKGMTTERFEAREKEHDRQWAEAHQRYLAWKGTTNRVFETSSV